METAGRDGQICASVYRIMWTENLSKNGAFCCGAGKKKSEILQPVFHLYMKVFRQVLGTHTCSYALNGYCVLSFSSV